MGREPHPPPSASFLKLWGIDFVIERIGFRISQAYNIANDLANISIICKIKNGTQQK